MNHRHLLPTEIDLLLDDEEGFGVAPLRAHVRDCADCQARLTEAQSLVHVLEALPLLAPSHRFADRVMAQVPVFAPWHVAARDAVRQWMPTSRPARVALAAFATSLVSVLTVGILWLATRTEVLVFAAGVAGSRVRELGGEALRQLVIMVFGEQVLAAIAQTGLIGLGLALLAFLAAGLGTLFGLRAIAVTSSRRRG